MKLTHTMAAWRPGGVAALLLAGMSLVAVACGDGDERDKAEAAAKAFAEAYFNYDIAKAAQFCTDDSQRWLRFAASNVYGADLEVLRGMEAGATVDIDDIDMADGDSMAVATVRVGGYMQRDTIGKAGRVVADGEFRLGLVRGGGEWKVRMEALPRSGR